MRSARLGLFLAISALVALVAFARPGWAAEPRFYLLAEPLESHSGAGWWLPTGVLAGNFGKTTGTAAIIYYTTNSATGAAVYAATALAQDIPESAALIRVASAFRASWAKSGEMQAIADNAGAAKIHSLTQNRFEGVWNPSVRSDTFVFLEGNGDDPPADAVVDKATGRKARWIPVARPEDTKLRLTMSLPGHVGTLPDATISLRELLEGARIEAGTRKIWRESVKAWAESGAWREEAAPAGLNWRERLLRPYTEKMELGLTLLHEGGEVPLGKFRDGKLTGSLLGILPEQLFLHKVLSAVPESLGEWEPTAKLRAKAAAVVPAECSRWYRRVLGRELVPSR